MSRSSFLRVVAIAFAAFFVGCASTPPWGDMTQDEIAAWKADGFSAADAQAWAKKGFDPKSAQDWHSRGFDLEATLAWKQNSFTADSAQRWRSSGFGLTKAVENRGKGLTPIETPENDSAAKPDSASDATPADPPAEATPPAEAAKDPSTPQYAGRRDATKELRPFPTLEVETTSLQNSTPGFCRSRVSLGYESQFRIHGPNATGRSRSFYSAFDHRLIGQTTLESDDTIERLDVNSQRFDAALGQKASLHRRRDRRIVDLVTYGLVIGAHLIPHHPGCPGGKHQTAGKGQDQKGQRSQSNRSVHLGSPLPATRPSVPIILGNSPVEFLQGAQNLVPPMTQL